MIRKAELKDSERICEIYNHYILNTAITFETEPVTPDEIRLRIEEISEEYPYYVYEEDGKVAGYCYLNKWHKRAAFKTTVENSIYLDPEYRGRGIGKRLLNHLIMNADTDRIHSIIACITLPNEGSVCMHEKAGFKKVSFLKEVGYKFDKWQDIGHWQLIL